MLPKLPSQESEPLSQSASRLLLYHQYHPSAKVADSEQLMCVKKLIPSLCKLYLFYAGKAEKFSDKFCVDSCFTSKFLSILNSSIDLLELAKGPTKKFFPIKQFDFCKLKAQKYSIPNEETKFSRKGTSLRTQDFARIPQSFQSFRLKWQLFRDSTMKPKIEIGSI